MATHELALNLKKTNIAPPVITVHQGDSAEVLKAAIYDGDKKAALTGCKVYLMAAKPDHTYVEQQFTGISDNVATVTVDPAVFGVAGLLKVCYVRVRNAAGLDATTENVLVNVLPSASASGEISGPYVDAVEAIIANLEGQLADVSALNAQMQKAEASRASAENQRATNEKARQTAETKRAEAEKKRAAAESDRVTEASQLKTASQAATAAANGAASNADAAANQALQIANSIAQGSVGDSNIADLRSQNEKLASMLANATGKFFFMGGTVYAPSAKASISNGTVTLGSTCSVSGTTIVLA